MDGRSDDEASSFFARTRKSARPRTVMPRCGGSTSFDYALLRNATLRMTILEVLRDVLDPVVVDVGNAYRIGREVPVDRPDAQGRVFVIIT